jgi:hypothetical protein
MRRNYLHRGQGIKFAVWVNVGVHGVHVALDHLLHQHAGRTGAVPTGIYFVDQLERPGQARFQLLLVVTTTYEQRSIEPVGLNNHREFKTPDIRCKRLGVIR